MPKGYDAPPTPLLVADYESGLSCIQVAAKHGVEAQCVRRALKAAGVPFRSARETCLLQIAAGTYVARRPWLGKKQPAELVAKRAAAISGANNVNWKGGLQCRHYRKVIAKEKCEACGASELLAIHHINFDHYDNVEENLQVLCLSCHSRLHTKARHARKRGEDIPVSNSPIGWR